MQTSQILVVDDNPEIREIFTDPSFCRGVFRPAGASDGMSALQWVQTQDFDLIILDVMMPGPDGYQTCQRIRASSNAPILFLSAKSQENDKLQGFLNGGDDYLSKPFSSNELIGRVKALLRRYQVYRGKKPASPLLQVAACFGRPCRPYRSGAWPAGGSDRHRIRTSPPLLLRHPGQIFSPAAVYEQVWGEPFYAGANNTIMVHIRNLRKKIEEDPKHPVILKTVWGKGYCCEKLG